MLTYHIERHADGTTSVIETGPDGSRPVDPQQADYVAWLDAGNLPGTVDVAAGPGPSLDELKAQAVSEIKQAAYRYIVARYPEWQQNNAACAVINSLVTGQPSPDALEHYAAMRTYIDTARLASNEAEAQVLDGAVDTPERLATVMEAIRAQYAADIPS